LPGGRSADIFATDAGKVPAAGKNDLDSEVRMASVEECRKALESLTGRLSNMDAKDRAAKLADRTLSCRVSDLGVTFLTRLGSHGADPIVEARAGASAAQIRFTALSDDVMAIGENPGIFAKAWLSGRIRVEGSFMDLLQLRKLL
jgi:hypothetical protein